MAVSTRPAAETAALTPGRRMTLEEFFAIPEGPPKVELEEGELIVTAQPSGRHQKVLLRLGRLIDGHVTQNQLGVVWPEIDVHLPGKARVYVPDLVFLASDHADRYSEQDGRIHGVPDLVVEIISPSTERRDRTTKFRAYQQAGVPWYWLADPDELIMQEYKLTPEGYLLAQSVPPGEMFIPGLFPGLSIDLAALMGVTVQPES